MGAMLSRALQRPRRRWLRISIRGLFVLVLLVGGWLGRVANRARIQREAVAVIERAGGKAWYDWEWKNGSPAPSGRPGWPRWLVDGIGPDYFGHVTAVFSSHVSDAELAHIGHLSRLEYLILGNSPVTDAGLEQLERLESLRALNLQGTRITDAGLAHLEKMPVLHELGLGDTEVSDAGIVYLEGLSHLTVLGLEKAGVTVVGFRRLQEALPKAKIRCR